MTDMFRADIYYVIIQMTKRVSDKLAMNHDKVKQRVGDLMGGHVIELDIFKAEEKAEARGESKGISKGADLLANLIKKLTPGSPDYNDALNGTDDKRQELFKKYNLI